MSLTYAVQIKVPGQDQGLKVERPSGSILG